MVAPPSQGYTCVFPAEDSVLPRIGQLQHHSSVEPGMQVGVCVKRCWRVTGSGSTVVCSGVEVER